MTISGNINFPSNNGTNGYLKNAGYIKVGGAYNAYAGSQTCFLNGGRLECNSFVYMSQNDNCNGVVGNRFTFGSSGGSCIFRYLNNATLYKVFTSDSRWQIYQAGGSSQAIAPSCNGNATGWGNATVVASAPVITAPSGEQPCNTITCLTLPVELLRFVAQPSAGVVVLSWATATETNCEYFAIERSTDMLNWKQIATVPGSGSSSGRKDYSYTDTDPEKGIVYYRLSQHDYNGQSRYFDPVYAESNAPGIVSSAVFPVPSHTGEVTLAVSGIAEAALHIELRNLLGELVPADVVRSPAYSNKEGQYTIRLPEAEQVFVITVFDGQNVAARHRVYSLKH
jgi:hypothetical protein